MGTIGENLEIHDLPRGSGKTRRVIEEMKEYWGRAFLLVPHSQMKKLYPVEFQNYIGTFDELLGNNLEFKQRFHDWDRMASATIRKKRHIFKAPTQMSLFDETDVEPMYYDPEFEYVPLVRPYIIIDEGLLEHSPDMAFLYYKLGSMGYPVVVYGTSHRTMLRSYGRTQEKHTL